MGIPPSEPSIFLPSADSLTGPGFPDPPQSMCNCPFAHHHFPAPPGLCVAEPSLLNVVSPLPHMPEAQLCHTPTMFGQRPPFSDCGPGAAAFLGGEDFAGGG